MDGCDKVFHLAALAAPWAKNRDSFDKINVDGAQNVFEAAQTAGVSRVVFTSTVGTIGPQRSWELTTEEQTATSFLTDYERTKALAEQKAMEFVKQGMDIVIVNPTRVVGPGPMTKSNAVTYIIKRYIEGKWRFIPGNGKSLGNYVYVDDVVEGHLLAMEKGRVGERYILGGENTTFEELCSIIKQVTKKRTTLFKIPVFLMMIVATSSQALSMLTGKAPLITPPWVRRYMHDWGIDSTKAKEELGYQPRTLHESIKMTVDWVKN